MSQIVQIVISPESIDDYDYLKKRISKEINIPSNDIRQIIKRKQSLDARQRNIKVNLSCEVFFNDENIEIADEDKFIPQFIGNAEEIFIIGSGPAGLFAALRLIEKGYKPIIIERGKFLEERKKDVAALNSKGILNNNSNWCFGEGGAGTFTDGKLYTRSSKRGNIKKVINTLIQFGASEEIAYSAHPHIGTDKLPLIIKNIRESIIECGGIFRFTSKLTDIFTEFDELIAIEINNSEKIKCRKMILATGHSASDIYQILNKRNIYIEPKPFAIGCRIEHPQSIINEMQYKSNAKNKYLPPAEYSITKQVNGRGVYSFCMCPGGIIVPAGTNDGELVVNGMSNSKRNGELANSGFVVELRLSDFQKEGVIFSGLDFRKEIETKSFEAGGGDFVAPAQRLTDFINSKTSKTLPHTSYYRGISSINLRELFPKFITDSLVGAFTELKHSKREYITEEAVLIAPESRTSSPLLIKRDSNSFQSVSTIGIYPCGEGAGYAGGITSAALDGINIAEKI